MPTSYEDQFFTVDPGSPPLPGTLLTFSIVEFIDENDDGLILNNSGDTFNGVPITDVWQNDTLTIELPGGGQITYTGVTFYFATGPAVFTPTDGQVLQDGIFVSSTFVSTSTQTPVGDFGPTCFTPGTFIETPTGPRLIEKLIVGDLVTTLDHGPQPIRMVVRDSFRAVGDLAPIYFAAGALENTEPLIVSPQHRMLVTGWRAELYFGQDEVLVAAKHLVNGDTIRRVSGGVVTYIHLLFEAHEIIFGQGIPSESFFPGHAVEISNDAARAELLALFPDLETEDATCGKVARRVLRRAEAQLLAA